MTNHQNPNRRLEKFAHALLATSCLSVAAGSASAATILIVEGTSPAPSDFPNSSPGYLLPYGTNEIQGSLTGTLDTKDWFEFENLIGGQGFSLHGVYTPLHQEKGVTFQVFNSSNVQFGNSSLEGQGRPINGTVPGDGELIVEVQFAQAGNPHYQFTLAAEYVPEPAPVLGTTLGLGLMGALAWRRKRGVAAEETSG
jgi:hypothetical protein